MSTMRSAQILSSAISDMQQFYGLEVTGQMDPQTIRSAGHKVLLEIYHKGIDDKNIDLPANIPIPNILKIYRLIWPRWLQNPQWCKRTGIISSVTAVK